MFIAGTREKQSGGSHYTTSSLSTILATLSEFHGRAWELLSFSSAFKGRSHFCGNWNNWNNRLHDESFNHIAIFYVAKLVQANPAFKAGSHFRGVVFKSLERNNL